ncbi:uncharacterized protein [Panulirus ornatus]|uniref:uncharacterized protein isoform X4 n=1 Tax=Panulirus ornatus TaxID=150431 RepID=UPI003A84C2B9
MKVLVVMFMMVGVLGWPVPGDVLPYSADIDKPVVLYEFAYEVSDPDTGNFQNRVEVKLANGDVFGSWSVLLPSQVIMTVVYNVTDNQGFRYTLTMVPVSSHDL